MRWCISISISISISHTCAQIPTTGIQEDAPAKGKGLTTAFILNLQMHKTMCLKILVSWTIFLIYSKPPLGANRHAGKYKIFWLQLESIQSKMCSRNLLRIYQKMPILAKQFRNYVLKHKHHLLSFWYVNKANWCNIANGYFNEQKRYSKMSIYDNY